MIRNIVFDMGKVIIRFDPDFFMDREGVTDPADRDLIRRELFRSLEWAQMDLGVLSEETAEPRLLPRFPERLHSAVHRLLFAWSDPGDTLPGMEDLVRRLKAAGYRIYLLSNASTLQPLYWPKIPVSRLFDGTFLSCDLGVVKPCREIYRAFTDRFSLRPGECVFIDDLPANAAGAVSCGWQGIVFHGDAGDLEQKLKALGVCPAP